MNNEINPHEVLSTQDTQLRRKKQQNNKSKETRTLNLTGNVDLGLTRKNLRKKSLKFSTTTTTTTTTEHPNEIPNYYQQPSPPPASSNHHRHNHNTEYNGNEYYRRVMASTSTQFPIAYQLPSSLPVTKAPKQSHISTTMTSTSTLATSAKQKEKVNLLSAKEPTFFLLFFSFNSLSFTERAS